VLQGFIEGPSIGVVVVVAWNRIVTQVGHSLSQFGQMGGNWLKLLGEACIVDVSVVQDDCGFSLEHQFVQDIKGILQISSPITQDTYNIIILQVRQDAVLCGGGGEVEQVPPVLQIGPEGFSSEPEVTLREIASAEDTQQFRWGELVVVGEGEDLADAVEDVQLGMLSVALHEVGVHLCHLEA
jgi:hypothetical protein